MIEKTIQKITSELLTPYGDLIEINNDSPDIINSGSAQRFSDLSRIHLLGSDVQACVHIYRAKPVQEPIFLYQLERHPYGSQLFMPLDRQPFIVVVAPTTSIKPQEDEICAFLVEGGRGVNLFPGTWHHSLISLVAADFLVVERTFPQDNVNECSLVEPICLSFSAIRCSSNQ